MDDLVRLLQAREDVSFEEASYYLKKANGNIDKAVFLIQKKECRYPIDLWKIVRKPCNRFGTIES